MPILDTTESDLIERIFSRRDTNASVSYPVMSGREIYTGFSNTGLNRSPINKLLAFILANVEYDSVKLPPPFNKIFDITERLLVDGSFALLNGNFLEDIIYIKPDIVILALRDSDGVIIKDKRRVILDLGSYVWVMDQEQVDKGQWQTIVEYEYPKGSLFVYPNGVGILYHSQKIYFRLEDIERTIRDETGESALRMILSGGFVNADRASRALSSGSRDVVIPGDMNITQVQSTETISFLLNEAAFLLTRYKESVYDYIDNEAVQMSGVSRRLLLLPTLQFVQVQRDKLVGLYEMFGVFPSFEPFSVLNVSEMQVQIANLEKSKELGAISEEELKSSLRSLLGMRINKSI